MERERLIITHITKFKGHENIREREPMKQRINRK
jgi:hypothetical protein